MEWTATPSRSLVSSQMETLEVCDRKIEWFLVRWRLVFNDLFVLTFADTGKRKKKGNELEQIDCTPPEHILPGSKERPLVPLQPQNKDWKVGYGRFFPLLFSDVLLLFWHVRLLLTSVCSLCSAWRSWPWVAGTLRLATGRCMETSCICTLWLLRTDTSASQPPPADSTSISKSGLHSVVSPWVHHFCK